MKAINMNQVYTQQVENIIKVNGLEDNYGAMVRNCSSMSEVLKALSNEAAQHVAVLTESGQPIDNMFEYIKGELATHKPVVLALFFEKNDETILDS